MYSRQQPDSKKRCKKIAKISEKTQAIAKISSYCLTQQKDEFRSIVLIFNPLGML